MASPGLMMKGLFNSTNDENSFQSQANYHSREASRNPEKLKIIFNNNLLKEGVANTYERLIETAISVIQLNSMYLCMGLDGRM